MALGLVEHGEAKLANNLHPFSKNMMKAYCISLAALCFLADMASAQVTIYSSDFEANNGGWTSGGFGDWEYGVYNRANYTGDESPPPAPTSGEYLWGTVLNADYSNSGDISVLSQSFDLANYTSAELSWQNWAEVFFEFDTAILSVNGDALYSRDTRADPLGWELQTVDLTPYAGGVANVQFELSATTVVDRAGWYIDDVRITAVSVPEPSSVTLFGIAYLGLVGCRRIR